MKFKKIMILADFGWSIFNAIALSKNVVGSYWWQVNTGSGNDLVPSGNEPLIVSMSTQFYAAIYRHYTTMG